MGMKEYIGLVECGGAICYIITQKSEVRITHSSTSTLFDFLEPPHLLFETNYMYL